MGDGERLSDEEVMARIAAGNRHMHQTSAEEKALERQALGLGRGEAIDGVHYARTYKGGVALMELDGPIYRRANSMKTSGALSTGMITADFRTLARRAKEDGIRSLLVTGDGPGGEATQADEMVQAMRDLREVIRVETFYEGLGASLMFWILSTGQRSTASKLANIGSLGVVMGVPVPAGKTKEGRDIIKTQNGDVYIEFKSAKSPLKRADPTSEEGQAQYQRLLDHAADVFIADVARNLNMAVADVPERCGWGGIYDADEALERGMIDEVGTFQSVFERLSAGEWEKGSSMVGASGVDPTGSEADAKLRPTSLTVYDGRQFMGRVEGESVMSLLDYFKSDKKKKGAAAQADEEDKTPKAGAAATSGLTIREALTKLQNKRLQLEEAGRFESDAYTFMLEVTTGHKVLPELQEHIIFEMNNAMLDDAVYGGTVVYPVRGADGQFAEAEGTREEQTRTKYEDMSEHSFAEEKVQALREGKLEGRVLSGRRQFAAARPNGAAQAAAEPENVGTEAHSDEELLSKTSRGQRVLVERNKKAS